VVEREVTIQRLPLDWLLERPHQQPFVFAHDYRAEPIADADQGRFTGVLMRENQAIDGCVSVAAKRLDKCVWKITLNISNETEVDSTGIPARDQALAHSFASLHSILKVRGGQFVSSQDPPPHLAAAAGTCRNRGLWPVLVGEKGQRDTILAAPIILYDYPEVAAESPGDLFDSTEIDEILSLRVLTLTEDEQRQMAAAEQQTRALLQRTQSMDTATFDRLHGTLRRRQPAAEG
jgi:hypothetical protein